MPWVSDRDVALVTDLYELRMAAAYRSEGRTGPATFDLFVRKLPANRNFLVAAGIDQALDALEALAFDDASLAYLEGVDPGLAEGLAGLTFTGEVWAVPEGEVVFPAEPLLRVTAPLPQAQLVETLLLNTVGFPTMIASKAVRVGLAAAGRPFVDYAARRTHGADAALKGARAAMIAGAASTSMVLAGREYGVPISGTMAHAYVMAHDDELEAFRAFARRFPQQATLLIDTYDTLEGARRAVQVAHELADEGIAIGGVRLDSGDLAALAVEVRRILDAGGCEGTQIIVSGDLDEYRIAELLASGAPIDAFGVGTRMGTSRDAPSLGIVYKLAADERGPVMKLSEGKRTDPGVKQVWRRSDGDADVGDMLALADEDPPRDSRPLLVPAMRDGARLAPREPVADLAARRAGAVARLPERLLTLTGPVEPYPVERSSGLTALVDELRAAYTADGRAG